MTYFRLLSLVILLLYSTNLFAQEDVLRPKSIVKGGKNRNSSMNDYKIRFGFEFGSNFDWFSQSLSWDTPVPQSVYNVLESASGRDNYFAVLADFPVTDKLGIQAKFSYEGHTFSNENSGIMDCIVYDPVLPPYYIDAYVDQEFEVSGADFGISALLRYNITNDAVLTFGPMMLIPIGDYNHKITQTITSEECFFDYGLPNQSKVRVLENENASLITSVASRVGLDMGIAYYLTLVENVQVAPQVRLNYMFSNFSEEMSFTDVTRESQYLATKFTQKNAALHSLKFGIGIWF